MNIRINLQSGAKWEHLVGYSRAVKIGDFVYVSGTTAVDKDNNIVGKGNAYEQTIFILEKIEKILQQFDFTIHNVARTRMFVKNIDDWEQIGKAHSKFFKETMPATTMVEVSRLIDSDLLVEIEADAVNSWHNTSKSYSV